MTCSVARAPAQRLQLGPSTVLVFRGFYAIAEFCMIILRDGRHIVGMFTSFDQFGGFKKVQHGCANGLANWIGTVWTAYHLSFAAFVAY